MGAATTEHPPVALGRREKAPDGARRMMSSSGSAAVALPGGEPPLMADLMCGPNLPLTKAFLWCGWRTVSVDWLLDPAHDLSNPLRQKSLAGQLEETDFIAAAMDCSTKSRAREIPRKFNDGRPAPQPLRSAEVTRAVSQGPGSGGHRQRGMRLDAHTAPEARRRRGGLALVPPPGAGDDGVRTVEGHAIFRMRVCGGPEQTPVPQTQRPGDRGVAAFDVPPYPPPPSGNHRRVPMAGGTRLRPRRSTRQCWHSASRWRLRGGRPGSARHA